MTKPHQIDEQTAETETPILNQSPNRPWNVAIPKDQLTPKVVGILDRDKEALDWDIAKELDQPSHAVEEVLLEIADISCNRMFGNVYRLKKKD